MEDEISKPLKLDLILSNVSLTDELAPEDLKKIGYEVVEDYDEDEGSRETYINNLDQWTALAMQVAEEKTWPWPNSANVKFPLLTTSALQFSARAYPALLPGTNIVRGQVIGRDPTGEKTERAIRVGKHMSYQLLYQMDNWEEDMDRLLFTLPITGCVFKKTYYDPIWEKPCSEIVYPKELVVNYWASSLERADRITHVLKLTDNDIHERIAEGLYADVDLKPAYGEDLVDSGRDSREGIAYTPEDAPYKILEQHKWCDLDGDGYKEPYIVTVDYATKQVLRIVPRFGFDSIKFSVRGEVISIKADNYFTKFSFIPSPDGGFYDIGFGNLLGPINQTIDTTINQLLDAGTLSNMQAGFISKGIRIKGGSMSFDPGEWKMVQTAGDDLKNGIFPLPVREPSTVLFQLLNLMITTGEKLSSVQDMMTGELPGQNTKATVALASIEQGMKVFSSIYKRIYRSLTKEYQLLFKINHMYLSDKEYFAVLDGSSMDMAQISVNDYNPDDMDVRPTADPNVATEQQKLAKVQFLMELLSTGLINPVEVVHRALEATEQTNIEKLMSMPPPQPSKEQIFKAQELALEERRIANEEFEAVAKALLQVAQAEAAEQGHQLQTYQAFVEEMAMRLKAKNDAKKEVAKQNGSNNSK